MHCVCAVRGGAGGGVPPPYIPELLAGLRTGKYDLFRDFFPGSTYFMKDFNHTDVMCPTHCCNRSLSW